MASILDFQVTHSGKVPLWIRPTELWSFLLTAIRVRLAWFLQPQVSPECLTSKPCHCNLPRGYGARITQLRYSRIPNPQILCKVKNGKFPDYFLHSKELVHHSTLSRQYHFLLYKTEVSARSSTFSPHFLRSLGKLL